MTKTVVALFDGLEHARAAVQDLVEGGFSRGSLSLVAHDRDGRLARDLNLDYSQAGESPVGPQDTDDIRDGEVDKAATGMGIGAALGGLAGMMMGLGALMVPGIGPVLAAGPLLATLGGAGIGAVTGGMIGSLADSGIPEDDARLFADGVQRGGTLLLVNSADEQADRAAMILNRHHPVDLGQQSGTWKGFDEDGEHSVFDQPREQRRREPASQVDYGPGARAYLQGSPVAAFEEQREHMGEPEGDRTSSWRTYESRFRHHYAANFAESGRPWEDVREAYRFGFELAQHPEYSNRAWAQIEPYVRDQWDTREMGRDWDFYAPAVRDGWEVGHTPA